MTYRNRLPLLLLLIGILLLAPAPPTILAQDDAGAPSPAPIVNDEGGPVNITGEVTYTNPFFTRGVAQPVVILEDQAGFVDRNEYFIMPVESQTLGQITSDFYTSPFSYSITLPIEPQGTYRDVDQDGETDQGVQTYAIAYWENTFGDPYLEVRDLSGGGWSTAYASTRVSTNPETRREIVGGTFLVYAPDERQGFPSGFGDDGLLFTDDDPIVTLPQGYTLVDMDTDPFTFDRSRNAVVDLIEPEEAALVDLSDMGYAEAFNELVDTLIEEYAFTEYKGTDWEALRAEFLPRFEAAEEDGDARAYLRALRDFAWSIPDGHITAPFIPEDFQEATAGGIGISIRDVDNGSVIVNYVTDGSPAAQAGIERGDQILAINGVTIDEYVDDTIAFSAPFSTEHVARLQKLRYATRFPLGEVATVTFVDDDTGEEITVELTATTERESFLFSSFNRGVTGFELPIEYELLDDGYGYAKIYSFFDNSLLTIQIWERMIQRLNEAGVPGLIIDLRQNGGGSGFLADQMAAYFFNEPLVLGNTAAYDEDLGEFYIDPRGEQRFYLPSEDLRYNGEVVVLVGPNCASACEFFAYDMTLQDRATIVGQYSTAGLGGSITEIELPENERFRYTIGRALDPEGNIHIEGKGVAPDVQVPVTEETLLLAEDAVLDAAIDFLVGNTGPTVVDGGDIAIGDSVEGTLAEGERVRYTVAVAEGDRLDITVTSDDFDPFVTLYDSAENLLFFNDDIEEGDLSAGFDDLRMPRALILQIEVSSVSDLEEGAYVLSVEGATGDAP